MKLWHPNPTRSAAFLAALFIVIAIYLIRLDAFRPGFQEGFKIRITGRLSEEPTLVEGRQRLVLGQVRVYVDRFPEYHYGDKVWAEGTVTEGKGGWYLKDAKVTKIEQSGGLASFRERILELYGKFLPEPHNALLSGIVLGTKTSLDSHFFEALRKTGTLHVIVASGTNIALFGGSLLGVLATLIGRRRAVIPTLLAIWAYVLLVSWQPPIVRAAVMGSIAFAAQAWGREFDAWRALLVSAIVLLLLQPLWLFDVGFQLSFAATAGILAFNASISRFLVIVPIFREDLATTLAAQITVTPILWFTFGQFSLISPLVNVLILWTVPVIMAGGAIVAILGLIWEPLGQVAAWFVWLPLEYFARVVMLFSNV